MDSPTLMTQEYLSKNIYSSTIWIQEYLSENIYSSTLMTQEYLFKNIYSSTLRIQEYLSEEGGTGTMGGENLVGFHLFHNLIVDHHTNC